ncbi:hypothetical protein UC8_03860 [Roseimaritima ulvae]|uniref:Zinc-ribbon domain-containing protein n=1 Tax=Roseimaritima ulvae TaxID=980254 RepID=A0A5B9QKB1_9BACT|nr:hypothetical protein UC8_03860 [Roseimaritima ulvae]
MELTARAIRQQRQVRGVGLETILDVVSVLALVFGIVGSLGTLVAVGDAWVASSIAVRAVLHWLWLRALAELIRLLKRSVGLEHAGRISGSHIATVDTCSHCGATLRSDVCCHGCGARLIHPEADA